MSAANAGPLATSARLGTPLVRAGKHPSDLKKPHHFRAVIQVPSQGGKQAAQHARTERALFLPQRVAHARKSSPAGLATSVLVRASLKPAPLNTLRSSIAAS